MTAGVIDTRNFAGSYEQTRRRLARLEQQISNPDISLGSSPPGSDGTFDEITINNPGVGADLVINFTTATPTGLSALTSTYLDEVYIDASWTSLGDAATEYEIEIARRTSPGVYDNPRVYRTAGTTIRMIVPLGGVVYGLRVASMNRLGIRSSFSSRIDVTTAVDGTVPGTISGLSVTAAINSLVVTFNRLADSDMQNGDGLYRVQLSSNDFSSVLSDKYTSSNVEGFTGLTQGTNYKVRVAGIDPSGNQGPWTTSSNVIPGLVATNNIAADAITGTLIAANTITGAKILAGSVDGDRITANTLSAAAIETSTLTAADITLAGGSLIAGTPVSGDGALLNSQGFKLYKDGQISVNLDALTGDATFAGNIVGSNIYGGYIESPRIVGSVNLAGNLLANSTFDAGIANWTAPGSGSGVPVNNTNTHAVPPADVAVTGSNGLKSAWNGVSTTWKGGVWSELIPVESVTRYIMGATLKTVGWSADSTNFLYIAISQYESDGVSLASPPVGIVATGSWRVNTVAGTPITEYVPVVTYPTTQYVRLTFYTATLSSPAGKYFLVDNPVLARDTGISDITYATKPSDTDRMILFSEDPVRNHTYDRIMFARPKDLASVDDRLDGKIEYYIRDGNSAPTTSRRRVLNIDSGGYQIGTSGYFSNAYMNLVSATADNTTLKSQAQLYAQELEFGQQANAASSYDARIIMAASAVTIRSGVNGAHILSLTSAGALTWKGLSLQEGLTAWTNVSLGSGWSAEGVAKYRKDGDTVELQGAIVHAGTSTAGTCLTLPSGYRPTTTVRKMLGVHQTGVGGVYFVRADIQTDGQVVLSNYSASVAGVTLYLTGVRFATGV